MTDLRTLKDFEWNCYECDVNDYFKEIKAEAIKWVKEFNDTKNFHDGLPVVEEIEDFGGNVSKFIKHFFNLTEEEIK